MLKPKVAFISMTSCEGCEVSIADLGFKFVDLLEKIDIINAKVLKEKMIWTNFDIAFVEGNPNTLKDVKNLKKTRKLAKKLIVIGNCAHLGGIPRLKDYQDKEKISENSYKYSKNIHNPKLKKVSEIVKVDFTIPGCPINQHEFLRLVNEILAGKTPKIPQNPVCYECQLRGYDCLLQRGELCFGPVTLGGCDAVCLKFSQACWGCRGPLDSVPDEENIKNLVSIMKKKFSKKEIEKQLEIFGVKEI